MKIEGVRAEKTSKPGECDVNGEIANILLTLHFSSPQRHERERDREQLFVICQIRFSLLCLASKAIIYVGFLYQSDQKPM